MQPAYGLRAQQSGTMLFSVIFDGCEGSQLTENNNNNIKKSERRLSDGASIDWYFHAYRFDFYSRVCVRLTCLNEVLTVYIDDRLFSILISCCGESQAKSFHFN